MIWLGIESSCDETAVAVLDNDSKVLSSVIASQVEVHTKFGGVVPEVAAREHLLALPGIFSRALDEAQCSLEDIDAIAVTQGPGLIGALLVGAQFAKGLGTALRKPIVPVDHIHAHVHGALLGLSPEERKRVFPTFALVVSGGHTNLYRMENPNHFQLLAWTIDDACGECFDKVAKMLGLGYPGGPWVEKRAKLGRVDAYPMPRMLANRQKLAFSYSGLKTHINRLVRDNEVSEGFVADVCAGFQREAFDQIFRKIKLCLEIHPDCKSLLVSGGVAANQEFRSRAQEHLSIPCFFPSLKYCSDNAAMVAAYGMSLGIESRAESWESYPRYRYSEVLQTVEKEG